MRGSRCRAARGREHVEALPETTREEVRRGRDRHLDSSREAGLIALAFIGALGLAELALEPMRVIKKERRGRRAVNERVCLLFPLGPLVSAW